MASSSKDKIVEIIDEHEEEDHDDESEDEAEQPAASSSTAAATAGASSSSKKKKKKSKSRAAVKALKSSIANGGIPQEMVDAVMEKVKEEDPASQVDQKEIVRQMKAMQIMDILAGKKALGGKGKKDMGGHKVRSLHCEGKAQEVDNSAVLEHPACSPGRRRATCGSRRDRARRPARAGPAGSLPAAEGLRVVHSRHERRGAVQGGVRAAVGQLCRG
jgi:hypothetical protein